MSVYRTIGPLDINIVPINMYPYEINTLFYTNVYLVQIMFHLSDVNARRFPKVQTMASSIPVTPLYEPRHENSNSVVTELVRHKPSCPSTEDVEEAGNFGFKK